MRAFANRLRANEGGGVTMLGAGAMLLSLGCAAFAVDLGSIWMRSRQLQGVADAAALAAAQDIGNPEAAARAAVVANGWTGPVKIDVATGHYSFDGSLAPGARFGATKSAPDAARVTLAAEAPIYFALVWLDRNTVPIARKATATRARLAAFSIGSRLAAFNGGIAGQYLSKLAGTDLQLSVMDYNALLAANVDLLTFSKALGTRMQLTGLSFSDILATRTTGPKAFAALADALTATGETAAANAARQISTRMGGDGITLSELIDLGPYGAQDNKGPTDMVEANGYAITRVMLELAGGDRQVKLDLGVAVPGVASTSVWIAVGDRPTHSPWLTVTEKGEPVIRTAQTRIYIEAKTAGIAGIGQVKVPLFVELASAEAKLADIQCGGANAGASVKLDVLPSVGHASIADIDLAKLDDHKTPMPESPATLVNLLAAKVTGRARVDVGGVQWQRVGFSAADIAAHRTITVSTNDIMAALASSLLNNVQLDVQVLGFLPLGVGPISSAVGSALAGVAAPLDGLLTSLTDIVGLKLGQADVRIDGVRCGQPALVA